MRYYYLALLTQSLYCGDWSPPPTAPAPTHKAYLSPPPSTLLPWSKGMERQTTFPEGSVLYSLSHIAQYLAAKAITRQRWSFVGAGAVFIPLFHIKFSGVS